MTTITKPNTYPNATAITITLASLASTATAATDPPPGREGAEIIQATDLANDVLLHGQITTGTSPTNGRAIVVAAWGAGYDGSTVTRPAGVTGTDANLTPSSWWKESGIVSIVTLPTTGSSNVAYNFAGISLLRAFGGLYLPVRWGIFVYHTTGVNLNSTGSNHFIQYTPLQTQNV